MEDLAKVATDAARLALIGWSPGDPDATNRLAAAIGHAIAAGIQRHEESNARHIALAMAGIADDDESPENWQV